MRLTGIICVLLGLLLLPAQLSAQSRNTGSGMGMGGGGNSGQGGGGGAGAGGGTRQQSSASNTGGGASRTTGTGTSTQTGSGQTGSSIDTAAGTSARIDRSLGTGFIGNDDSSQGFVGSSQATTRTGRQQQNFQQRQGSRVQGGTPNRESPVRPVLRIGFDVSQLNFPRTGDLSEAAGSLEIQLQQRFSNRQQFSNVSVIHADAGGLILSGTVSSEQDRKLAEAYLRLEPGVSQVENRLTVARFE